MDDFDLNHARQQLAAGQLFTVDHGQDPEVYDANVIFIWTDEIVGHGLTDLVDESVQVVGALEGVASAWREDTELVMADASGVELAAVEAVLDSFWRARL